MNTTCRSLVSALVVAALSASPSRIARAPEGTEGDPTVIGIAPNVYLLPGTSTSASLNVTKNYITLLGLTNNRRSERGWR